jgi:hypothetical protein
MFQHIARFSPFLVYLFIINNYAFGALLISEHRKAAFVHLKKVIVTSAVSWVLALLNESLKHHDWAGLTDYTSPFGFAISYVFDKQSGSPCHCDLQMPQINLRHP